MNFRVDNIAPSAGYNDGVYNSSFTRTTKYYIVSGVIIPDGEDTETVIDLVSELQNSISSEITRSTNKDNAHDAAIANVYTKAEVDSLIENIDTGDHLPEGVVVDSNYIHTDNNYTTTDKNKLVGIASGAEVNVQSDWNVTSTSSDAYIKNKPNKVSAFTNDAGYLTTETDPTVPSWAKQSTKPSYTASEVGALPSSTVIPSKTSDLTNDSNFISDANYNHTDNNYTTTDKNKLAGLSNYDDTALAGRVTANETALTNVYTKTQVDSKFTDIRSTTVGLFDGINNYVLLSADYDGTFDCNTIKFTDLYSGTEALFSLAPMGYALNLGKYKTNIETIPSVVDGICTIELNPGYTTFKSVRTFWRTAATVNFTFHTPTYVEHEIVPEYYLFMAAPGTGTISITGFNFDNLLGTAQTLLWKDGTTPDILTDVTADRSLNHIIKFTLINATTILGEVIKYKS